MSDMTAEKVLALWDAYGGWIPGSAYRELAAALGEPEERLLDARRSRTMTESRSGWDRTETSRQWQPGRPGTTPGSER